MYSREELYKILNSEILEEERFEVLLALALLQNDFNKIEICQLIKELLINDSIDAEALSSAFFACIGLDQIDGKTIDYLDADDYTIYDLIDIAAGAMIVYGSVEDCATHLEKQLFQVKKLTNKNSKASQVYLLFLLREFSVVEDIQRVNKYISDLDNKNASEYYAENPGFFYECYSSIGNLTGVDGSIEANIIAISILHEYGKDYAKRDELVNLYNMASGYYLRGDHLDAKNTLDKIICEESEHIQDSADIISMAYSLLAEITPLLKAEAYDDAIDIVMKAHSILERVEDDHLYNHAYLVLSRVASKLFLDSGDYKRSETFSNDLCRAYRDGYGDYNDYLVGLTNISISYFRQGLRTKSKEIISEAIDFVNENSLQETAIGQFVYNTNQSLFAENDKTVINDSIRVLESCDRITPVNLFPVVNAISVVFLSQKRISKYRYILDNAINKLDDYITAIEEPSVLAQYYNTKSIYYGYIGKASDSLLYLNKAVEVEIHSGYKVDVTMVNLGIHGEMYEKIINADDLKRILLDLIHGFPYRAWELLKLTDEMSILKGLSHLSEEYKYVLTEHYRRKIFLTDIEFVEIIVNCKNIYSDILKVRREIKYTNPWYEEQYGVVDKIHRNIINLELGRFFNHNENKEKIVELKNERHEKELQLIEDQPYSSLGWMNIYEIKNHLPDNSLYIDYLVMPPVSANENAYIKDLVYNRFALVKINGELKIKILSYQNMLKIRYQMDILEGLLREKYGKSGILSLGRKLKGDNAVLINLYKTLFKESVDFARKCGIETDTMIISGDAELSSFPYDALIDERGKYLVEKYDIINVNSLRNYFGSVRLEEGDEQNAIVVGNPMFTIDPSVTKNSDDEKYLVQIPLSKIEAQAVADAIGVKPSLRMEANKELLTDNGCKILHIATHGDHLNADYASEMQYFGIDGEVTNPLLTNCIFMSGANDWIVKDKLDDIYGNGIVTAEELCSYNLPLLKVVTLSACFTGSGDINYQLGLLGMRTALMATGARAIITNLWEVDDFASAVFMTRFYQNMKSMTVSVALKEAKVYLMNVTLGDLTIDGWFGESRIRRLGLVAEDMKKMALKPKETRLFEKPFYWAGFTIIMQ